jgi:hypothetical protein
MEIAEVAFKHRRGNQGDRARESVENRLSARQNGSRPRSAFNPSPSHRLFWGASRSNRASGGRPVGIFDGKNRSEQPARAVEDRTDADSNH